MDVLGKATNIGGSWAARCRAARSPACVNTADATSARGSERNSAPCFQTRGRLSLPDQNENFIAAAAIRWRLSDVISSRGGNCGKAMVVV